MRGFQELTTIEKALELFFRSVSIKPLQNEQVSITDSIGRILAEDIVCKRDLPPFNRSAVDGYALRSEDTFGASPSNPLVLDLVGRALIGRAPQISVSRGQAVEIATGAPVPESCDAVMMLEYTERTKEGFVEVHRPVSQGENVSRRGEDVEKGQLILEKGIALRPQDVAILAALGLKTVRVSKRPIVAVLSTGDELQEAETELRHGMVFDSNRPAILSMTKAQDCVGLDLGLVPDDFSEIKRRVQSGIRDSDIVIVTGGTSTGERDLLPAVISTLGKPGIIVHGVAMRPGRPAALCAIQDKPVILLPCFPVAAMLSFSVLVKPILQKLTGLTYQMPEPTITAKAVRRVPSALGNRTYVRVVVTRSKDGYVFEPLRISGSGVVSSLVRANGIVAITERVEGIETGDQAEVTLLRPVKEALS